MRIQTVDRPQRPAFLCEKRLRISGIQNVFIDHPELFDDEARHFVATAESRHALEFDLLTYVDSIEESRQIDERDEPMVIISASGMIEAGRVIHHVRHHIEDPRHTILIVSYQAPNTLGRVLVDGEERVKIRGQVYERKADIAQIGGLSSHAGQGFLLEYAQAVKSRAKQIFRVHGEDKPVEILREELQAAGLEKVYYPYLRQSIEI